MKSEMIERFRYHTVGPAQTILMNEVRNQAITMAVLIDDIVPEGREQAIALRKLEESQMYAMKAISHMVEAPVRGT